MYALLPSMKWNLEEFLFVCDRRDSKQYHGGLKEAKPALSSLIITMVWRTLAGDYTVQTHRQIPPLLAKSAGCIQQSLLFLQHLAMPKFLQGDHTVSKLSEQCRRWFTVKHSKAGLQTSSHPQNSASHLLGLHMEVSIETSMDYRACNRSQLLMKPNYL